MDYGLCTTTLHTAHSFPAVLTADTQQIPVHAAEIMDPFNDSNKNDSKKSLQHRYFQRLNEQYNAGNSNDNITNTTNTTNTTNSSNYVTAQTDLHSDSPHTSDVFSVPEQSMGYFDIPTRAYSPERLNSRTRSNSVSPMRVPPNNSPYTDYLNNTLSKSGSPSRRLLDDNDNSTIQENPFLNSTILPPSNDLDQTELRPIENNDVLNKSQVSINRDSYRDSKYSSSISSNSVFGGYEFDEDELDDNERFAPFPVLDNTYYPVNLAYDIYNPFDKENISSSDDENGDETDDDDDDESEDYIDEADLLSGMEGFGNSPNPPSPGDQNTEFRNAQAVNDTVNFYDSYQQQVPFDSEEPNPATKQVRMVDGNLVLDCPVSEILLSKYKYPLKPTDREFLFMRFQACTAEPEQFQAKKFSLRQKFYNNPRETELMIVVTMYNENEFLLARTLKGIFKNIRYFCNLKNSSTWGPNAWQKIVVCIVSDGRQKINQRSKALLAALGVYQEGFAKNTINDEDVVSHIYEYTTMVGISKIYKDHITLTTENCVPVQMIFCLKEQNKRKINSHKWAFKAFAPVLNPNVVILLDVGTEPENKSLYRLWKSFKDRPNVAGSCGEIKASLGKRYKLLLNPLVAAQNFEYKTSNILDKPMESVFGFVTVLPGAFSAYRYEALQGVPLETYLKGEDLKKNNDDGIFNANMYLAEDRILCFELIAKLNSNWILTYINTAGAYTDVPEYVDDFITQRRRWLNGSFFAAIYSVWNFYKIYRTSHSTGRKVLLQIEFFYQFLNLLVSWFSLGSYFLVFRILSCYLAESDVDFPPGNVLSVFFLWLYMASLTTTFVLSFGNKPKGTKKFYLVIVIFFALLMCYMIFASIFLSVKSIRQIISENGGTLTWDILLVETQFRNLLIAISSTYALYFIGFLLFLQPVHMFTSFIQYLLLSPAYVNILNIYAFCNIHDISWGTKGQDKVYDLGIARKRLSGKNDELDIVIPTTKYQIDNGYSKMVQTLMTHSVDRPFDVVDQDEKNTFYFAFFRSMTVLVWMFSNFILVAIVTETGGLSQFTSNDDDDDNILPEKRTFVFLSVILYTVAFMALFRFVGCVVYLFQRGMNKLRR